MKDPGMDRILFGKGMSLATVVGVGLNLVFIEVSRLGLFQKRIDNI